MTFIRIGFTASMVFCALLAAAAVAQEQDQKNDKTSPPRSGPSPTLTHCRMMRPAGLCGTGATSLP